MKERHYLTCSAVICNDDPNPFYRDHVIWWPGELICTRKPYEKYQQVQIRINKAIKDGKFKDKNIIPFTANELENSSFWGTLYKYAF